jgi:L-alanine-DL-glutamate epimerase-like enolase superfamily enzyme
VTAIRFAGGGVPVERLDVSAYTVPTDAPESDGTLQWDSTTIVVVEAQGGDRRGIGYSYTHAAAAELIRDALLPLVRGRDAMDVPGAWAEMRHAIRNVGRPGLVSTALAAVDTALWDLKARLLEVPLVALLGAVRETIPLYGSGGFTSYSPDRLREQLGGWAEQGFAFVKMKVGRHPDEDLARLRVAREAIGEGVELFVDANGAYGRKRALAFAASAAELGVTYFEEPVSSDDLEGLRLLRDRGPPGMQIAAGEYGYDLIYFRRMLDAGAVDILQADVTRCGGITELLRVAALCESHSLPLSGHTAPMLHAHAACAIPAMRHLEWFHDHARIERLLFDGALEPDRGTLRPDRSRPGIGIELKRPDAERYVVR